MPLCGFIPERDERHLFRWFGPNGLTFSADLPATILNQVCRAWRLGAPVTTDNRLVGIIHGAFTADLPTCIVKFNTVAHPGGDDADEHAVIGDVTKRNRPGSGFVPIGPEGWLRRYLLALVVSTATGFRPTRRAQDAVAEIRHFTARSYESVVEGDIEACFDEISDRASWIGCGVGSGTNASWPTSNPR